MSVTSTPRVTERGVGASRSHREGVPKVSGEFEFASDLHRSDALFGATLRSPHAAALIRSVDVTPALSIPGVRCALTHRDVPGRPTYGLEVPDQPVLAADRVRYHGEPVSSGPTTSSSWRGPTRSACRTRPFSAPRRASPSPPRTGASGSTWPLSGC